MAYFHLFPSSRQRCRQCVVCFAVAALAHCAIFDFTLLQIELEPAERYSVVPPETGVTIRFSRPVDRREVEQALQVSTASQTIPQRFDWEGERLTIRPVHTPRSGVVHELRLEGLISDTGGRVHEVSRVHHLFYGTDHVPRYLVSSLPADGVFEDPRSPVELRFSEAVDQKQLEEEISILPDVALVFEWDSDGKGLTMQPLETWQLARTYELRIPDAGGGKDIRLFYRFDRAAVPLEVCGHRFEIAGLNPPAVVPAPQGRDALVLSFCEAVDHRELRTAVHLRPHMQMDTAQRTERDVVLYPLQDWDSDTEYTVTVSAGLAAQSGNILTTAHEIVVRTQENRARLTGVTLLWSGGSAAHTDFPHRDAVTIEPAPPDFTLFAVSAFDRAVDEIPDRQTLLDRMRIQRLLPEGGPTVVLNQFLWSEDRRELTTVWSGLSPSGFEDNPAIYALSLPVFPDTDNHELILVYGGAHD